MALQLRKGHTSSFVKMIATSFAVLALVAQPLVALNLPAAFATGTNTVTVRGNTAAGENQPGWMFNRDVNNATPTTFSAGNASIGLGSAYVAPLSSTDKDKKFIGEYFTNTQIADINSVSVDFKIGAGGTAAKANQFYLNVYANYAGSAANKYYDCKYDVVASVGSTSSYTTLTFDPTQNYPVTKATQSWNTPHPASCPSKPSDMGAGAFVRMIAINMGDTSLSDAGLDGYFDNFVFNTDSAVTAYDFEKADAAYCAYDFPTNSSKWEINWGTTLQNRNDTPAFNLQSNGGLVKLNGAPVPSYMTGSWHWLYLPASGDRHYDYEFADGTIHSVDVTYSTTSDCQSYPVPNITWKLNSHQNTFSTGGWAFHNRNQDRDADTGEEKLAGWDMKLYYQKPYSSVWTEVGSDTTDANGNYHFGSYQAAGTYYTCEVLKAGWTQTKQDWGGTPFHVTTANNSPNKASEGPWCASTYYTDTSDRSWATRLGNVDTQKPTGSVVYTGGTVNSGVIYLKSINDLKYTSTLTDNYNLKHTSYAVWKTDSNFTNATKVLFCGNWNNATTSVNVSGTNATVNGDVKDCNSGAAWPDGNYLISHVVYDVSGNLEYFSAQPYPGQKFVVDSDAPVVTINSPANGSLHNSDVPVVASIADANLSHHYLTITRNGNPYNIPGVTGVSIYSGEFNNQTLATLTQDGNYVVKLEARDKAGNKTSASVKTVSFTIDKTAPSVPTALLFDANNNGVTNGYINTEHFTFNLGSSSDTTRYQLKYWNDIAGSGFKVGSPWNPTNLSGYSAAPGIYNDRFSQGEGVHYFAFSACDAAGNCSAYGSPFTVTYDKTAPPAPTADFTPNADGTQKVELEDTEAGVSIYYTTDGATPTTSSNSYNGGFSVTPAVAPAVLTIKAIAVDAAGNVSSVYTVAGPSITNQASQTATTSAITLVWTTGTPATSRVVYDTVPHAVLGSDANYGYAFSTVEDTTKTTNHSVTITGLTPGTTYYFRIVSHGSPTTVSPEITSLTLNEQLTRQNATPTFQVNTPQGDGVVAVAQNGDGAVLGTETGADNNAQNDPDTNTTSDKDVKGAEDVKGDDATSPLGVAWYWWVLALAAVATGIWWLIAARKRRKDEDK